MGRLFSFAPVRTVPRPKEIGTAAVFMYGYMNGVEGWWIRNQKSFRQLVPPSDYDRNPLYQQLSWGVTEKDSSTQVAWVIVDSSGNRHVAEAFKVLSSNTRILDTFQRIAVFEHNSTTQTLPGPIVAPAERFGQSFDLAVSDTPYRVDKNGGANPWLTVRGISTRFRSWHYDIEEGTPSGWYDLRPACENRKPGSPHEIDYPPPPRKQSQIAPGSSDVGCFRWVPNPAWDASDPHSPKYHVNSYDFDINESEAPTDAPKEFGSTWETVNPGGMVVESSRHYNQRIVFGSLGLSIPENAVGATWYEDTQDMRWALIKRFGGESRFRYRYPCTFRTVRIGSTTEDPGRISLAEGPLSIDAFGLRTLHNSAVVRDDAPSGLLTIARESEGAWPSDGGWLLLTNPAPNTTLRGLARGSRIEYKLWPFVYCGEDGDFYVWATEADFSDPNNVQFRAAIVRASSIIPLPNLPGSDMYSTVFTEKAGRVWVEAQRIIQIGS